MQHTGDVCTQARLFIVLSFTWVAAERVRMSVQPEAIKVPVQMHGGQEDSMKGLSDPEVQPVYWHFGTCNLEDVLCPPCTPGATTRPQRLAPVGVALAR